MAESFYTVSFDVDAFDEDAFDMGSVAPSATPSTIPPIYASNMNLNLGQVPQVEDPELYQELLDIHDALEMLASLLVK